MARFRELGFSPSFVTAFLREAGVEEGERAAALQAAAIAPGAIRSGLARITEEQFGALFRHLANTLEDELPGLLSRPLRCGAMKYAALSVITAPSLGVALRRHARYLNLVIHDFEVSFEAGVAVSTIAFEPNSDQPTKEMAFALMLKLFHGLASWLVGRELPLTQVSFTFDAPPYAEDLRELYPGPIGFGRRRNELVFPSSLLDLRVKRNPQDLRRFLDRQPLGWLSVPSTERPTAEGVRDFLLQCESAASTIDEAAQHLGMSSRNLSRHLKEEGASFREIKDGLRFELAVARLTQTDDPLSAIAEDLGFSDASSFHRAFRNWTGVAPGSFRRRPSRNAERNAAPPRRSPPPDSGLRLAERG